MLLSIIFYLIAVAGLGYLVFHKYSYSGQVMMIFISMCLTLLFIFKSRSKTIAQHYAEYQWNNVNVLIPVVIYIMYCSLESDAPLIAASCLFIGSNLAYLSYRHKKLW